MMIRQIGLVNKHLVCIGFGKCGTTLLNYLFARSPGFRTPVDRKEICYFSNEQVDYEQYLQHFEPPGPSDGVNQVFFEASPPYATARNLDCIRATLERIESTIREPTILLCLRHPAYRAYSHYVHNLQAFAAWGRGQHARPANHPAVLLESPFAQTFEETIHSIPSIKPDYFETVKMALDIFGNERVKFFYLERDARNFSGFFNRLCAHFQVDAAGYWDDIEIPRVFSTESMPSYIYCPDGHGLEISSSKGRLELDEGNLLVRSTRDCYILEDVPPDTGRQLLGTAKRWTSMVTAVEFRRLFETYFAEDVSKTVKLMRLNGIDSSVLERYENYTYKAKQMTAFSFDKENFKRPYRCKSGC